MSKPGVLIPICDAKADGKTVQAVHALLLALNSSLPGKCQQASVCLYLCAGVINRLLSDLIIQS